MSQHFTLYDAATGEVLFSGSADDPAALAGPGQAVLLEARHEGGWIAGGLHHPQPAPPGPHHTFDWTTKQWVDPRTLADLRAAKWTEIRRTRDTLEATSFPYLGKPIDSDIVSVLRINTSVKAADYAQSVGAPFETVWRCADNTDLALDGPAMQMMPVALAAHAQGLHAHARTLRTQIDSADAAGLAAIAW